MRGVTPPTNFYQIAFGSGIPSKFGEGSTKQDEGFECWNRLAARTDNQTAQRCEEEEGTGVASDVVKVQGEDPAAPGPLI